MNAREAKKRREIEEQEFRASVLDLVEQQKGVIGALARGLTAAQKDIADLQRHASARPFDSLVIQ